MSLGEFLALSAPYPWVVGVVNVTPDSFSDGGLYHATDKAIEHAKQLAADGASWIELGAESTRPNSDKLDSKTELNRLIPVVEELSGQHIVAIDTYHSQTASECLRRGAKIINDVSALRADKDMAKVVADFSAAVVLMYSKECSTAPHATLEQREYQNVTDEIVAFLGQRIEIALNAGILRSRIIVDPGMGTFISPNHKYSFELLRHFDQIVSRFSDFPTMVATSRKSFLGGKLSDRDPLSQLSALHASNLGAKIIRTHNVKMCLDFIGLWDKLRAT